MRRMMTLLALLTVVAGTLSACDPHTTPGEKLDRGIRKTGEAIEDAGESIKDAGK